MPEIVFPYQNLKSFASQVLKAAGVDPAESEIIADNLITANLRGIDSHGIVRLALYIGRFDAGLIAPKTKLEIAKETSAACVLDANNGWGAVAGLAGMRKALEKARSCGVGVAMVRNSNHFGIAAFYAQEAVKESMIGLSLTNASATMAPWGGLKPYFGTNPICIAVPAGRERPIIYDGATSVAAIGKIVLAAKKGVAIPEDWATDKEGRPTTDPQEAAQGNLLPMGGYKGYGFALMVDVLAGILSGAAFGQYVGNLRKLDAVQNVGHMFAALDIKAFSDLEDFQEKMEQLVRDIREIPQAPRTEKIYLPGEIEWNMEERRLKEGIPLPQEVFKELQALSERFGIPLEKA